MRPHWPHPKLVVRKWAILEKITPGTKRTSGTPVSIVTNTSSKSVGVYSLYHETRLPRAFLFMSRASSASLKKLRSSRSKELCHGLCRRVVKFVRQFRKQYITFSNIPERSQFRKFSSELSSERYASPRIMNKDLTCLFRNITSYPKI